MAYKSLVVEELSSNSVPLPAAGLLAKIALEQGPAAALGVNAALSPLYSIAWDLMPESVDFVLASLPLLRAVLNDASTTDDRMPMMAMTTSNSMRVKPRRDACECFFIFKVYQPLINTASNVVNRHKHGH